MDDHPIVRQGLAEIIERTDGLDVHGEAGTVNEAIDFIARDQPQLVLVDVSLDGSSGLDLVKALKTRYPGLHTLVLSMFDEKLYGERAIRAGARGYVMKQEPPEKIIRAIRTVLDGGIYLSDSIKENILNSLATEPADGGFSDIDSLTDREFEIFQLIGHGLGNRHIAEKLHVSIKTVENMREKIKTKLHMESSADLLQYAVQWMIEKG
ncbi:MAG: response regulator transcription factor [Spirochaetota bacterium]